VGLSGLRQADSQAYTNENAIEERVVDQADQLSQSLSEEDSANPKEHESILTQLKPKRFANNTDIDGEGYNASNSDNNIERRQNRKVLSSRSRKDSEIKPLSASK